MDALDDLGNLLRKGGPHKYVKRVPKPGGGYRYYYTQEEWDNAKPKREATYEALGSLKPGDVFAAVGDLLFQVIRAANPIKGTHIFSVVSLKTEKSAKRPVEMIVSPNGKTMINHKTVKVTHTPAVPETITEMSKVPEKPSPKDTPRREAQEERQTEEVNSEYVNDRASSVEQRGEDVVSSAREKAMEWKGARSAARSKDAAKIFTKVFLERQEPLDLVSKAQGKNVGEIKGYLGLHFVMKKFPGKPDFERGRDRHLRTSIGSQGGIIEHQRKREEWNNSSADAKAEIEKKAVEDQRESYYEAYNAVRDILNNAEPTTPLRGRDGVASKLRTAFDEHSRKYGRQDAGTEALRKTYNATIKFGKTSPARQVVEFERRAQKWGGDTDLEKQAGLAILEGKSMNVAFGEKKDKGAVGVDLAQIYSTDVMNRKGPKSEFRSVKQGLDALDDNSGGKYRMRGVQWGKSVTDEEREHHLKSLVDSCHDLTDVLGLPPEMASFNGKLAIAIGARGKGGALAHYEPSLDVINLTRSSGAGSLAHEWGHFFDYTVSRVEGKSFPHSTTSQGEDKSPTHQAFTDLMDSEVMGDFRVRLGRALVAGGESPKKYEYWSSRLEMFARCFEKHVQGKLRSQGRENTYLTSAKDHPYWPTTAETKAMAPMFDKIFEAFSKSDSLKKAFLDLVSGETQGAGMDALDQLGAFVKGARGGKYYKRVPKGGGKKGYAYFYTKASYEAKHGDSAHLHGPDVKASKSTPSKEGLATLAAFKARQDRTSITRHTSTDIPDKFRGPIAALQTSGHLTASRDHLRGTTVFRLTPRGLDAIEPKKGKAMKSKDLYAKYLPMAQEHARKAEDELKGKMMMPEETKGVDSSNWDAQLMAAVAGYHEVKLNNPGPADQPAQEGGFKEQPLRRSMSAVHEAAERDVQGVPLAKSEPEMIQLGSDPDLGEMLKSHRTSQRQGLGSGYGDEQVHSSLDSSCPIHGGGDITKSENLGWDNPYMSCSCGD